jgi:hypothetical protein
MERDIKPIKVLKINNYFQLTIPHVQGDPFATPSKVFINIKQEEAKFPVWLFGKKIRIHTT